MKQDRNKVSFSLDDGTVESFFVMEQTVISGRSYLLVADSTDDEAQCLILRERAVDADDACYEIVEDEKELAAVSGVFEELLDDTTIEL